MYPTVCDIIYLSDDKTFFSHQEVYPHRIWEKKEVLFSIYSKVRKSIPIEHYMLKREFFSHNSQLFSIYFQILSVLVLLFSFFFFYHSFLVYTSTGVALLAELSSVFFLFLLFNNFILKLL